MEQTVNPRGVMNFIKKGKWIIVIAWIVILALTLPFVGKLSDAVNNTSNLPASDQATIVSNIVARANPTTSEENLIVVYQNKRGITAQNKQLMSSQRRQVIAAKLPHVTKIDAITYAADEQAAYFTVLVNVPTDHKTGPAVEQDVTTQVRRIVKSSAGLTASTTGQVAIDVDSGAANANAILLLSSAIIVAILLILTYRSVLLWMIPLLSAMIAVSLSDALVYVLVRHGMQVNSLDSAILIILVFGMATDYSMLLISRYRAYLHAHVDKNEAVALALKGSFEAIGASAATVALASLSLVFAIYSSTKDLGPVAAIGVACAFIVQMTFLPAVLAIGGRGLLWPRAPKSVARSDVRRKFTGSRLWDAVAQIIGRYPRRITVGVTLILALCALGLTQLTFTVNPTGALSGNPPSMQGEKILNQHFASINNAPLIITANHLSTMQRAQKIAQDDSRTSSVSPITDLAGHPSIEVIPKAAPYSSAAFSYIDGLRAAYHQASLSDVNVGGQQAWQYDYGKITKRDDIVLIPIILLVVGVILGILLRSIVAPIMLLVTVILSFAGSFGISNLIFQRLLHFPGMDPGLPIYIFVFVVALGVDYNIFLMDRVRQEAAHSGTHDGMLQALRVTGGVITAAGLVLAGTFAALAQIPVVKLTEVGVAVALGVLIDSFLVRSFLVPAIVLTIGSKTWWPGKLARKKVSD